MKEEERDRARARILDGAAAVFSREGFERARIDDVAAEAGVSIGTVYNYFAGKSDLVVDLHQRSLGAANRFVEELVTGPGTFPEKLDIYLEAFFRVGRENRVFLEVLRESPHLLRMSPRLVEDRSRRMRALLERHVELVATLVRQGMDEGVLHRLEPEDAALALLGLAKVFALRCLDMPGRGEEAGASLVRRVFLEGTGRRASGGD